MKHEQLLFIFLFIFILCNISLFAEEIAVSAALEKNELYVGESFIFQISVTGSRNPEVPKLSGFDNFTVTYQGGGYNTNTSISFDENGKQIFTEKKTYIFQYSLVPKTTGTFIIPSVMVKVEGKNYMTESLTVVVRSPQEQSDYKLRIRLSAQTCYIGEKINATVTWYLGNKAQEPVFTIPLFNDSQFDVLSPAVSMDPAKEYVTLTIGKEQVNAVYSTGTLSGKSYTTVSFTKILVPKKPGIANVPAATVSFQGVTRSRRVRDFFGREYDKPEYGKMVIPSNTVSLTVRALPEMGKPVNFSGLIGRYSITAGAAPVNVRVGDPITLTLTLKGDGYLEDAELPPLHEMPSLAGNFKIPNDMSPGDVTGNEVKFIQTIRALNDRVTEIPPIEIPYFNSKTGKYDSTRTKPIPITVEPASKELSVLDMEGKDPIELKREIEIWEQGIAYNYEGKDILHNQAYGLSSLLRDPLLLFLILFPVVTYLILLYIFRFSFLVRGDTNAIMVRKSLTNLTGILDKESPESEVKSLKDFSSILMENLKQYLGAKCKRTPGSLTFKDIEEPLKAHNIPEDTLKTLKSIFEACEASHYAGGAFQNKDIKELKQKTRDTVAEIERSYT
ncbi:MAG: BatD family protein [Spirochaetales bacterium]|nr:BatD family protein [Spirochaetales bacterium]